VGIPGLTGCLEGEKREEGRGWGGGEGESDPVVIDKCCTCACWAKCSVRMKSFLVLSYYWELISPHSTNNSGIWQRKAKLGLKLQMLSTRCNCLNNFFRHLVFISMCTFTNNCMYMNMHICINTNLFYCTVLLYVSEYMLNML
jgi:hypothetical protein